MSKSSLKASLRILVAVSLLLSIIACGQKGDLVRPGTPSAGAANASPASR
ncbi:MAG: lipoprotein [Dokdonella sp.]